MPAAAPDEPVIRSARAPDVPAIAEIIRDSAELGLMLPKSHSTLYERLRAFHVAEAPGGEVIGVCGLQIIWADLGEVMSLAVAPWARGRGLGAKLVRAALDDADRLGIRRVMSLTYEQRFFERLGFSVVDRQKLPMKVWAECVACPKKNACDEIAMIRVNPDLPPAPAPPAGVACGVTAPVVSTALTRDGRAVVGG